MLKFHKGTLADLLERKEQSGQFFFIEEAINNTQVHIQGEQTLTAEPPFSI